MYVPIFKTDINIDGEQETFRNKTKIFFNIKIDCEVCFYY